MNKDYGTLFVVGTPIGNLEDISLRALRVLKEADVIAAEDTRHSVGLLNHYDIHTPMIAYHKFNERSESEHLCGLLQKGQSVALISDAGMPVISDPGYVLIRLCREKEIPVTVIPGANAALSAVVLSGMDCARFTFLGFIGKSNKEIKNGIDAIAKAEYPTVLYESPHRLLKMLSLMAEKIPHRQISISREITKHFEETQNGSIAEMAAWFSEHPPKGEFVLVIDGKSADEKICGSDDDLQTQLCRNSIDEHLKYYLQKGMSEKEAMKAVAGDRGVSKREIYSAWKVKKD